MAKVWYCYNKACKAPLGMIVNGELVLRPGDPAVSAINTEGAILNVQCSACGRPARWVPKDSALTEAFINTHLVRALVMTISQLFVTGKNKAEADEVTELNPDV